MYHQNWLEEMDQIGCCKSSSRSRKKMGIRNKRGDSWRSNTGYYNIFSVLVFCFSSVLVVESAGATSKCWSTRATITTTATTATVMTPDDPFQQRQSSFPLLSSSPSSVAQNQGSDSGDEIYCQIADLHIQNLTSLIASVGAGTLPTKLRVSCGSTSASSLLPAALFQGHVNIRDLSIQRCRIGYIAKTSFDAFEHALQRIDLSFNSIWGLPDQTLCKIQLRNLNLSHNAVSDMEDIGLGDCANSLQVLDLSWNHLRRVTRLGLRQLRMVNLSNNKIEEIDEMAFAGSSLLTSVDLSSNRFVTLPNNVFKFASNHLNSIKLQNNSISVISPDLFNGLIRLVVLELHNNKIKHIDEGLFKGLVQLQILLLQNNLIESVHKRAFTSLPNLSVLNLSNNKITTVDGRFSELFVLRNLFLDHNLLQTLDEDTFKNNSLTDLGLSGNLLSTVPTALKSLKYLTSLDIGENRISVLHNDSLMGMSQLIGLRMCGNQIEELPKGLCDPIFRLRVINLAENQISKVLPHAISSCKELRILRLDSNNLDEMPPHLPSNLLFLNMSNNNIKTINNLPKSLEWLDISHNKLEYLTDVNSPSLRVLDASFNKLKELDIRGVPFQLETLRLNHNGLIKVAAGTFIRSRRLRRVELVGNLLENLSLTSIQIPPMESGKTIPELYIGNNNFTCDCSMDWLLKMNRSSETRQYPIVADMESVTCTPAFTGYNNQLSPLPVLKLEVKDFLCPYVSYCGDQCYCCEFDACDCNQRCVDPCKCGRDSAGTSNIIYCNSNLTDIPHIPMGATHLYLDNNTLHTLKRHEFLGKRHLNALYLNNSRIQTIQNRSFHGLKSLQILHLENNELDTLSGNEFTGAESLVELFLHNNLIRSISKDTFSRLSLLEKLTLHNNQLSLYDFTIWEALNSNLHLNSLTISNNPFSCECEYLIGLKAWVAAKQTLVVDFATAKCTEKDSHIPRFIVNMCDHNKEVNSNYNHNNNSVLLPSAESASGDVTLMNNRISSHPLGPSISKAGTGKDEKEESEGNFTFPFLLGTFIIIIVAFVSFLVVLVIKRRVSSSGKSVSTSNSASLEGGSGNMGDYYTISGQEKLFDAFFIYSKRDEFVVSKLVESLEGNPTLYQHTEQQQHPAKQFRFCLFHRDLHFSPENPWTNEILTSLVLGSDKVFVVISNNFLNGEWDNETFKSSVYSVIKQYCSKLIFIRVPPAEPLHVYSSFSGIPSTVKLDWGEGERFWQKFLGLFQTGATSLQLPYTTSFNHNNHVDTNVACIPNIISSHHQLRYSQPQSPFTTVHPLPSQLTPREFGYSNIHQMQNNNMCKAPLEIYSSSAVSSGNSGNSTLDHIYSTLDLDSPCSDLGPGQFDGIVFGNQVNRHQIQNSTSSGISSGSDGSRNAIGRPPMYFV